MEDADLFLSFSVASAVAVGVGVCGVGLLVFAPRGWLGRAAVAAVGLAGMSGVSALLTPELAVPLAGGGAVVGILAVLFSTASVRRFIGLCLKPLAHRRVVGAAALLAASGVWVYEAWRFDRVCEQRMNDTLEQAFESVPVGTSETNTPAATDRGTPVPLLSPTAPLPPDEVAKLEATTVAVTSQLGEFIRREPPKDDSNCHGWVFTGGRFHLGGRYVPVILADNGYTPVSTPAPGDVCVYRGIADEVAHSGVVRAVLSDGTVLVESKWGRMGVYLHEADESAYGTKYTFYRSSRAGHLLNGLGSNSAAASAQP